MPSSFVTGATGQDGSYLCELLAREGHEVHALVRGGSEDEPDPGLADLLERVPGVVVHDGDLADTAGLAALVDGIEPDEVYNLAGISSVAYSWREPAATGLLSGVAVAAVLDAAWALQERTGRAVRVVQASSAEIFGDAEHAPQDESTPVRPTSPYGAAKAYAHHMVGIYRARGLHAASVILYNHESPRRPPTFVTRKITQGAARIAAGLDDVLTLGSLDVTRDWGWAPDYVDAMVAAARHDSAGDFVIATGVPHTVEDFVRLAFSRVGIEDWQARVRTDPAFVRPADASVQLGDASRARRELGWTPTTTFEQLVAAMVDHDVALLADGSDPSPA
ncbi:GDP-mannose 4,6-dehydratase [Cellulomonas cellasea]|uniref:GDP-mannose 4,6-dehydratase n=1 Tax=Cellulomonas cellasea TaxID=43670 RepID=A0A7W4YBM7_9CELL|nr:GDP-mannose 4,6-dehydratase [Cellulomonas cellasea]MBB2922897.1 GDPmannose 4,6-dehydratase [Cellulomonas cellasea]